MAKNAWFMYMYSGCCEAENESILSFSRDLESQAKSFGICFTNSGNSRCIVHKTKWIALFYFILIYCLAVVASSCETQHKRCAYFKTSQSYSCTACQNFWLSLTLRSVSLNLVNSLAKLDVESPQVGFMGKLKDLSSFAT